MTTWQLQDAKNRFSEVVERAHDEGPQVVTKRGVETAVVLSIEEYHKLCAAKPSFKEFLAMAPLDGLKIRRSKDRGRDVAF